MKASDEKKMKYFENVIDKAAERFATNTVLSRSRYLFVTGKGKSRVGYCTHCNNETHIEGGVHSMEMKCPSCKKTCTVKLAGYGRKRLYDYGSMLTYRKALKNKNAIIAVHLFVSRDYRKDYRNVKTEIRESARYYFEIGNSSMYIKTWQGEWTKCRSMYDYYYKNQHYGVHKDDLGRLKRTVKGTQLSHIYDCFMTGKEDWYSIEKLALYCKHLGIEYVIKAGYKNMIQSYIEGVSTGRTINWRGKTVHKFLRLTSEAYKKVKGIRLSFSELNFIQEVDKTNHTWNREQMCILLEAFEFNLSDGIQLMKFISVKQIVNYIRKQFKQKDWDENEQDYLERYSSIRDVVRDWIDYLRQCDKLEYNLHLDAVLRPKDLLNEHTKLSKLIEYKENKKLDNQIAARMKNMMETYFFESQNLFIRPAASTVELIEEGKALRHCVGGYANNYASGECTILFVRKKDNPDTPFFTVEIKYDRINQARGFKNIDRSNVSSVDIFLKLFEQMKLMIKEKKAS